MVRLTGNLDGRFVRIDLKEEKGVAEAFDGQPFSATIYTAFVTAEGIFTIDDTLGLNDEQKKEEIVYHLETLGVKEVKWDVSNDHGV